MIPAEAGPRSLIDHIWHTVPGVGSGTLLITNNARVLVAGRR